MNYCKKIGIGLILMIGLQNLMAQEKKNQAGCNCRFQSINQVGLLEGSSSSAFQLQTINGARYKNWFAGIGAGLDYYYIRSVPLFFDLRANWWDRKNTPFVYGDIGMQFAWPREQDKQGWMEADFSNGLYYGAGLGYKVGLRNYHALSLSVGYSYKFMRETRKSAFCPFAGPCVETNEVFDYKLNRLSMNFGWQF